MPLSPSGDVLPFCGYVDTTADALRLIQAARCGIIPRITRRLNELERRSMIKSGAIFVFSVEESGIKRWTDGYTWTPSRISGNFLVYREVIERLNRSYQIPGSHDLMQRAESHGALKVQGLIKKTITVKIGGSDHHLICYYTHEDIRSGRLQRPTTVPTLMSLDIPHELIQSTNFRYPPKLELGPDGRLIRIRDSDESSHQSESPSPIDCVARIGKDMTGEGPSDLSQAHFSGSDVRFSGQSHNFSSATHQHIGPHSPITSGMTPQPSRRDYYSNAVDENGSPTEASSPQWTQAAHFAYSPSPPPESSIHDAFSHPSLQSPSLQQNRWEPGISHMREDFSQNSRVRAGRQASGSGWCSEGRAAHEQSMASLPLSHSSEAASTAPVRTRESGRTRANSVAWGWEEQGAARIHPAFLPIGVTLRPNDNSSLYGPSVRGVKGMQPISYQPLLQDISPDTCSPRSFSIIT